MVFERTSEILVLANNLKECLWYCKHTGIPKRPPSMFTLACSELG